MTKDMTVGSPLKLILAFSIPLLIGNLFQQFYNMVDTLIVGRYLGVDALAGVGSTASVSFLVIGFIMGMTGGFCVLISQSFGAHDYDAMRHTTATAIVLCVILTVIITVLSTVFAHPLLRLMKTPNAYYSYAYDYIIIIFAGSAASMFYNIISGILRALGDSKTPLYFLIISSVINIVLDIVFIRYFNMGVAGAAWATVIAQAISGLLCLVYMKKRFPILKMKRGDWALDFKLMLRHLQVGFPMALQFCVIAIGSIVLQGALNGMGSNAVAAYTAGNKVEQICMQPLSTFGLTMATYCAQNLGANRLDRIKAGVKSCFGLSILTALLGAALLIPFGGVICRIFFADNVPEVLKMAHTYLIICSSAFPALGLLFLYRNALQGMGNSFVPFLAGVSELVMRIISAVFLSKYIGYTGVCLAGPLAWVAAAVPLALMYYLKIHRMQKTAAADRPLYQTAN